LTRGTPPRRAAGLTGRERLSGRAAQPLWRVRNAIVRLLNSSTSS